MPTFRMAVLGLMLGTTLSLCAEVVPAEEKVPLQSWTEFVLSRETPTVAVESNGDTSIVLHADRDISSLKIELEKVASTEDAGAWDVRLYPLKSQAELGWSDVGPAIRQPPVWTVKGRIGTTHVSKTYQIRVPRAEFRSWVIQASPIGKHDRLVKIRATASAVPVADRLNWLMRSRSLFNPEVDHALLQACVAQLTDAEVVHWTGFRSRRTFGLVRGRLTVDELEAFTKEEGLDPFVGVGKALPNGLFLHMLAIIIPAE
jgi:hypothetical protein